MTNKGCQVMYLNNGEIQVLMWGSAYCRYTGMPDEYIIGVIAALVREGLLDREGCPTAKGRAVLILITEIEAMLVDMLDTVVYEE